MALLPWSPLAGGLLAGALAADGDGRTSPDLRARVEAVRPQLEHWEGLCADLGEAPADVGIAWLLHQPAVTAPIIGPRTAEQLAGAIHATTIVLDEDVLARIDEIFPGPGPAPEAYAW
jgi:aryl-alcohol dehydrogenase-like predicted oxidoreductase